MSLADAALIKDNHVIAAGGVVEAYRAVRQSFPDMPVEVEVTSAEQAREVVAAGATDILLDNMSADAMAAIVAELADRATFEASGGLTLLNATEVAQTGVNFVAVGAITHSAPALILLSTLLLAKLKNASNLTTCQVAHHFQNWRNAWRSECRSFSKTITTGEPPRKRSLSRWTEPSMKSIYRRRMPVGSATRWRHGWRTRARPVVGASGPRNDRLGEHQ